MARTVLTPQTELRMPSLSSGVRSGRQMPKVAKALASAPYPTPEGVNPYTFNPEVVAGVAPPNTPINQPPDQLFSRSPEQITQDASARETAAAQPQQQQPANFSQDNRSKEIQDRLAAFNALVGVSEQADKQSHNKAPDPDNEPYGFDASDKMSMLGALYTGGNMGIIEMGARAAQLALKGGEEFHLAKAGASDEFTDHFNRWESRNKLYQDAIHIHPVISEIGKFLGQGMAFSAAASAAALALPEMGVAGAAALAGTTEAGLAIKSAGGLQNLMQGLSKPILDGAGKSLINASRVGKALKLAKLSGKGALIGETQYDEENNHYLSQAVTGALGMLALHGIGKSLGAFVSPTAKAIQDLSTKWNIPLPLIPSLEQFGKKIIGSNYTKTMMERGGQVGDIAKNIANSIIKPAKEFLGGNSFETFMGKELVNANNANKELIDNINARIDKKMANRGNVALDSTIKVAKDIRDELAARVEGLRNKKLENIVDDLIAAGGDRIVDTGILDMNGKSIQKGLDSNFDYKAFRTNLKAVGAEFELTQDQNIKGNFGRLYGAMNNDLEKHIFNVGKDVMDLFNKQKDIYVNKRLPFINGIAQAYRDDDFNADKFIGKFFKPDEPNRASEILSLMPEGGKRGRMAAQAAIMNHAMHEAEIPGAGFSPLKFVNSVEKLGKTLDVVFDKEHIDAFNGYKTLVNTVKGISPAALDPQVVGGLKSTQEALMKLGMKLGGYSAVAYSGIHYLGIPTNAMLALSFAPTVFARLMTSGTGRALMQNFAKITEKAMSLKTKDDLLSKFINFAAPGLKASAIAEETKIGREL